MGRPAASSCSRRGTKALDSIAEFETSRGALLAASIAARPCAAKPAQRRPGARRLLVAHAGAAQPHRHVDRAAREGRGPDAVRARPRLPRRHAADRPQARPHACSRRSRQPRPATSRWGTHDGPRPPLSPGAAGRESAGTAGLCAKPHDHRFGHAQGRPAGAHQPRVRRGAARLGAGLHPGSRHDGRLDPPADVGREGVPARAGARSAGVRPAHRPRRHGQSGAPGARPSPTWCSISARCRTPTCRSPIGCRSRPAFPMS